MSSIVRQDPRIPSIGSPAKSNRQESIRGKPQDVPPIKVSSLTKDAGAVLGHILRPELKASNGLTGGICDQVDTSVRSEAAQ